MERLTTEGTNKPGVSFTNTLNELEEIRAIQKECLNLSVEIRRVLFGQIPSDESAEKEQAYNGLIKTLNQSVADLRHSVVQTRQNLQVIKSAV